MSLKTVFGDIREGASGFFGAVGESLEKGVEFVATDVLPRWVGSELGLQSTDQLDDGTFDKSRSAPRVDETSVETVKSTGAPPAIKIDGLGGEGGAGGLMVLALAFGATFLLLRDS